MANGIRPEIQALLDEEEGAIRPEIAELIEAPERKPFSILSRRADASEITPSKRRELSEEQLEIIDYLREKESKPLSRSIRKITGLRPKSEQLLEEFRSKTPIKKAIANTVEDIAKIAPFIASPQIKGGLAGAKAVGQLIKSSAKIGGVLGASKAAEEIAQGEKPEKAAKEALFSALTGSILGAGTKVTTNTIKAASKGLFGRLSQVRNNAVQEAIKNPKIISEEQKTVIEAGKNLVKTVDEFGTKQSKKFEKALERVKAPKGNIINTESVRDSLIQKGVSTDSLKRQIMRVVRGEASDISENVIDRFLAGGNLTYNEARKVNSLLRQVQGADISVIGSGLKGKVSSSKKLLLDEIENKVPGTRRINKLFAKSIEEVDKIQSVIGKKSDDVVKKEATIRAIGEQLTGIRKNRTGVINNIKKLDRRMKTNNLEDIKNSVVSEAFENVSMDNLLGTIRGGAGIGVGSTVGAAIAGPAGAGIGGITGGLISQTLTSPQATQAAIRAGAAVSPVISAAQRQVPPSINSILFRNEDQ